MILDHDRLLPQTKEQFEQFCQEIFEKHELEDTLTFRRNIATLIMHLGPEVTHRPLSYFANCLKKAQANDIAYQILQDLKELELKRLKEAQDELLENSVVQTDAEEVVSNPQ